MLKGFCLQNIKFSTPADQSVDKSPCRTITGSEYGIAVKTILEKSCGSEKQTLKTSEESLLPKKGREKLASLLADLLGYPSAGREPEAKSNSLNLYESMSPVFGNELKSAPTGTGTKIQDSQQDKRAVIYENCLKCLGEHCHPPPRVLPVEMCRNRNLSAIQTFLTGLHPKTSQQHEGTANEELRYQAQGHGSQSVDGPCQYKEMNGQTVTSEGKSALQLITKLLRHIGCPFLLQSFEMDPVFSSL